MLNYIGIYWRIKLMKEELLKIKTEAEKERIELDKKFSFIAILRLIVFLVAVVVIFVALKNHSTILLVASLIPVIAFVVLVKFHGDLDDKILGAKAKINVINRFIKRMGNDWKSFKDNGEDFMDKNSTLAYDLDLLGPSSLYQLISVAHTDQGREKLAKSITLENETAVDPLKKYEAVMELSEKKNFIFDFESTSERVVEKRQRDKMKQNDMFSEPIDDENKTGDEEKEHKEIKTFPFWMYFLMILVPVMNIVTIVMVLTRDLSPGRILVTFIAGLILTWGPQTFFEGMLEPVQKFGSVAGDYLKLLKLIGDEAFKSEILKHIHDKVTSRDGLLEAIKQLGTIGSFNNIAFNPIIHMVLSGFTGWDYYIALASFRWNQKHSTVFDESIDIISDIEELQSMAVIPLIRNVCKPEISYDYSDMTMDMKDIYHPLLDMNSVVSNSAYINDSLNVITGSNMSGKTTFLRTIAINMVLSFAGCPVCASSFKVPFMKIFTSMRVMDDVSGGISTFYAEILRIKEMAEYIQAGNEVPALCLIDEIFKGTNSADRIVGASEALTKLSSGNSIVLVSTHDFELCELKHSDGSEVTNYHFEEYYENDALKFDYKIKDGRCTTRNAIAILKMAGLVQN